MLSVDINRKMFVLSGLVTSLEENVGKGKEHVKQGRLQSVLLKEDVLINTKQCVPQLVSLNP